jgi:rhomboid protease GluP
VPSVLGPEVRRIHLTGESPVPAKVGDRQGLLVSAEIEELHGRNHLRAFFVPRGSVVYQLVFTWPSELPRYGEVVKQMAAGIRFDEPRTLREARAKALLFPNDAWSLGELGEVLRRLGQPGAAAEALLPAVRRQPSSVTLRAELARAWLEFGQVEDGCGAAEDALRYGPDDHLALEVSARCELARGEPSRALERIERAHALRPGDERIKRALATLRQAVEESSR